jgi:hypothetical protein
VVRTGTEVAIRICGMNLWNFQRRVQSFGEEVFPVVRASGLEIADAGTRHFTMTAGVLWAELINRFTVGAKASGDTFSYWYYNGTNWIQALGNTQINNTQYNNPATGLVALSNNKYGVHWVYADHTGGINVVYGQGDYTLTEAQQAQPPATLPLIVSSYATLCAKIIIEEAATEITEIESAFAVQFTSTNVANHNDLGGLNTGDYLHLTNTEYGYISDISGKTDQTDFNAYTGETETALAAKADKLATINSVTATTYTTVSGDSNEIIECASGCTGVTLHSGATTGFQVTVVSLGTQDITFSAQSGSTLRSKDSKTKLGNQYGSVAAYKNGTYWYLIGDLE